MSKLFLEEIDTEELRAEDKRLGAKRIKRGMIKEGYKYMLSLYGGIYNQKKDSFAIRRIEVLSDTPWCSHAIKQVYKLFTTLIPPFVYSLWRRTNNPLNITFMGGYD
jgi:hypothetical protein